MRKSAKIITALSVAGLAVAGGSAFTSSNTFADNATTPLGHSTTTVAGATVNSLEYETSANGQNVTSAALVLDGDTSASTVRMSFNNGALFICILDAVQEVVGDSTYTCSPEAAVATNALIRTDIVVS